MNKHLLSLSHTWMLVKGCYRASLLNMSRHPDIQALEGENSKWKTDQKKRQIQRQWREQKKKEKLMSILEEETRKDAMEK